MPNCDFLAFESDIEAVLGHVFSSGTFDVYESYSEPEMPLRSFGGVSEIANAFPIGKCIGNAYAITLQLFVKGSGPFDIKRFSLDPRYCKGKTYRFQANGWGLIQLYFGGIGPKGPVFSHTNHNSEKRATLWQSTSTELGSASAWSWKEIESASRKLNRFVQKLSVARDGSRYVLPEVHAYLSSASMGASEGGQE